MIIEMTKDIVQSIVAIPEVVKWVAKVGAVPNVSANKLPGALYPAIAAFTGQTSFIYRENLRAYALAKWEKYLSDRSKASLSSERYSSQNWSRALITSLSIEPLNENGSLIRPTAMVRSKRSRARTKAPLAIFSLPLRFHLNVLPTSLPMLAI